MRSRPAYRDLDQLYDDLCAAYRKAVKAFYDAGCRYLQIDEVRMVAVADPKFRATRGLSDADFERLVVSVRTACSAGRCATGRPT